MKNPADTQNAVSKVHDLIEEYIDLLSRDDAPSIDEFTQRYPHHAEQLRQLLPASLLLAGLSQAEDCPEGSPTELENTPSQLGDFRLIRQLGRGGMGIVFEAEQISLDRRVALKILPYASLLDERQLKRFRAEARAAAVLKHPNIVSVYSVGSEKSIHFYAMEHIDGCSLADVIASTGDRPESSTSGQQTHDSQGCSPPTLDTTPNAAISTQYSSNRRAFYRNVARLGIQAADALQYAHDEGIIHRDIKPANLLLDASGNLHVADFGLARTKSQDDLTMTGELVGTLRYMSPEQIEGNRVVEAHSDIYSLGATLYEFVTGRAAFADQQRQTLLRKIVETEPKPPSHFARDVPKDLENIILKAMSKNPMERYSTGREMSDDLQCYAEGRPVKARRTNTLHRTLRWCLRNRAKAALLCVTTLMLLTWAIGGTVAAIQQANAAAYQATVAAQHRRELYAAQMKEAYEAFLEGEHHYVDELLKRYIPKSPSEPDLRAFEWRYLWRQTRRQINAPSLLAGFTVHCMARSPDGNRLAYGTWRGKLACVDAKTLGEIWANEERDGPDKPNHDDIVRDAAYSSDGTMLASVSRDRSVKIFNADTGEFVTGHDLPNAGKSIAYGNNGLVAVGLKSGRPVGDPWPANVPASVIIYRLQTAPDGAITLMEVTTLAGCQGAVESVAFSPDGKTLVAGSHDEKVRRWETTTFTELPTLDGHAGPVMSVCFSPGGSQLAVGSGIYRARWVTGEVTVWDVTTDLVLWRNESHNQVAYGVCYSPDGALIASVSFDKTARIWRSDSGDLVETIRAHSSPVYSVCFDDTSQQLYTGGSDDIIRRWKIENAPRSVLEGHHADVQGIGFSPNDEYLLTASSDQTIKLWSVSEGRLLNDIGNKLRQDDALACSPTGSLVAVAGGPFPLNENAPAQLEIWDYKVNRLVHRLDGHLEKVIDVAFSPDGSRLISGGAQGEVLLWDVKTGKLVNSFDPPNTKDKYVARLAFTDKWIVVAHVSEVVVWNANTFQRENARNQTDSAETDRYYGLAVSPDGRTMAAGGYDGPITLMNLPKGDSPRILRGHSDGVISLDFSPDGSRLVSGGKDLSVRLWDATSGLELATIRNQSGWVWRVKFSHDGQTLAIGSSASLHERYLVLLRAANTESIPQIAPTH